MPDFLNPFSGMTPERALTLAELTRALRLSLAAEEEATATYEALADATTSALAATVLRDIAREERVHAGEFQRLLSLLVADETAALAEGAAEVDAMATGVEPEVESETGAATEADDLPTIGSMR